MYDARDDELVEFGEDLYAWVRSEVMRYPMQRQESCLRLMGFTPNGFGELVCRGTCGIQLYFDDDRTSSVMIRLPTGSILRGDFGSTEWWNTGDKDAANAFSRHGCAFGTLYRSRGEYEITLCRSPESWKPGMHSIDSPESWKIGLYWIDGARTVCRSARITLIQLLTLTDVKVQKHRDKEEVRANRTASLAERRKRSNAARRHARQRLRSTEAPIDDVMDDDDPF